MDNKNKTDLVIGNNDDTSPLTNNDNGKEEQISKLVAQQGLETTSSDETALPSLGFDPLSDLPQSEGHLKNSVVIDVKYVASLQQLLSSLPVYTSNEVFQLWVARFEQLCRMYSIPETYWPLCVTSRLDATTMNTFLDVCTHRSITVRLSWQQCRKLLLITLTNEEQIIWRSKFKDVKMTSTFKQYLAEFRNIVIKLHFNIESELVITRFLDGLTNNLKTQVKQLHNYSSKLLVKPQEMNKLTFEYWMSLCLKCTDDGLPEVFNSLSISNKFQNKSINQNCHYCKEPGHFKRDCPKLKNQNTDTKKPTYENEVKLFARKH